MNIQGNFFMVQNAIFLMGLKPRDIAVYCCICRHINNETEVAFPSRKLIGKECGISKAETVDKAIANLCRLGLIEKYHQFTRTKGYTSNVYWVSPISQEMVRGYTENRDTK